ncbi:MAG TPA: acetate kinase [Clostridiaceae bacterium]|jgi:acetate kinase|nr:acetate kinase [Clostridiaceae bacterium]
MKNILVINCGSSSLKYQLIDAENKAMLARGLCDRIGIENSFIRQSVNGSKEYRKEVELPDHNAAIKEVIKALTDKEYGVIESLEDIYAVGHRVVHGGEFFKSSVIIDESVIKAIEKCIPLAPLHNPPNITGIKACQKAMPEVPQVAVFDTAFHQTMPKEAYIYALPYEYYEKYSIRKYGFHGTSHQYVAERAADLLGKPLEETRIITCHIGNGGSISAIKGGKSIDTSMGFTPLDGLVMGTRSGIVDAAAVLYIMEEENLSCNEMNLILNKKSGLLGVSGISNDMRDVTDAKDNGNERAELAIKLFNYRVKSYIGQYMALMGGADAIVFTAGIGENNPDTRYECCKNLEFLGIKIDQDKNNKKDDEFEISTDDSKVKVFVIATNEELAIAKETVKLV